MESETQESRARLEGICCWTLSFGRKDDASLASSLASLGANVHRRPTGKGCCSPASLLQDSPSCHPWQGSLVFPGYSEPVLP